ncbi:MAG: polysaccharide biosynthesis/export family protein [Niabella sp.]
MKMKNYPFVAVLLIISVTGYLSSCTPQRNLVYFSNLQQEGDTSQIINKMTPKIEKGDMLGITIITLNPEYNQLFSSGAVNQGLITAQGTAAAATNNNTNFNGSQNGYQVDENGQVNLPVLGKVALAGLTRKEAQDKLTAEVARTAKEPIVNVKFLNYKVTVIGEVTRPGSFTIPDDRVNVLEALGMAGDMTPYSVRENVLVIREKDGQRNMARLNLTDKEVFKSPYFYLQQNDVVYVQPENKLKARQADAQRFQMWSIILSSISVLATTIYYISRSGN